MAQKEFNEIYDFDDYKLYIKVAILNLPRRGRGFRSLLAKELRCQTAYISQVLNGNANLNPEQALVVNNLLGHNEDDSRFFLLLLQRERAGTHQLKKFFDKQIQEARSRRALVRERIKARSTLSLEQKVEYYSEWYYSAIHVLTSIPKFNNPQSIAQVLGLSIKQVSAVLELLTNCGLVLRENGRYRIGDVRIHLGGESPLTSKNHLNWRLEAMKSLERKDDRDLHYSSVVSLSARDFEKLKRLFLDSIDRYNKTVADSPEEEGCCLSLDFFRISREN